MKKLFSVLFILVAFLSVTAFSQWQFVKNFPDDTTLMKAGSTGGHGLAVDPEGKVWVQLYGATESVPGVATKSRALYVFNANGTPTSFSPIIFVTVGGVKDTLWNSGRGGTSDNLGNPVFSFFDKVYKLRYQDGTGLKATLPTAGQTLCAAAFDDEGYMYTSHVLAGFPAKVFDTDFNFVYNAVDTVADIGRTMAVSGDGLTLYLPRFTSQKILIFTRGSKFDAFTLNDSVKFKGTACESMTIHPVTKYLWFDGGSYFDATDTMKWGRNVWYGYDQVSKTIKDSIMWNFTVPRSPDERPRAIAFSPDGKLAYLLCFGTAGYPPVQVHRFIGSFVREEGGEVIKGFHLSQNYPNPFNPETKIEFSVLKEGFVTMKVFNAVGQEVSTLVNENLKKGNYSVNFIGKNLPSGTYIYQLTSNGQTISKKMALVK